MGIAYSAILKLKGSANLRMPPNIGDDLNGTVELQLLTDRRRCAPRSPEFPMNLSF
ncbi:hypothetical protein [Burkholderia ubonensis]|uniref:hypothetical protein n=1 Tax=Burkholderia ubonensis TaxID=101571 RepID=UPI0012F996F6|nr:hypothetical protein [Burkholderia ubonensis]